MGSEDQAETGPQPSQDTARSAHPGQDEAAPELETAREHSGSDHVSHGANSNLTPALAQTPEDAEAAQEIEQQHQES